MSENSSNLARGYKPLLDRWRAEGRVAVSPGELAKALGVSRPTVVSWGIPDAGLAGNGRRHYIDDVERTLGRLAAEAQKQAKRAKRVGA